MERLLNLLFRCRHRHVTRPITPIHRNGAQPTATYVACLECGKQFAYDARNMRVGKPIPVAVMIPNRGSGSLPSQA